MAAQTAAEIVALARKADAEATADGMASALPGDRLFVDAGGDWYFGGDETVPGFAPIMRADLGSPDRVRALVASRIKVDTSRVDMASAWNHYRVSLGRDVDQILTMRSHDDAVNALLDDLLATPEART